MDYRDIRKSINRAKFSSENSGILCLEIVFIAVLMGYLFNSWWVFGLAFVFLIFAIQIRPLVLFLVGILSFGWGFIAYGIGGMFHSMGASVVLGIIAFLVGLGIHLSALEWVQDMKG